MQTATPALTRDQAVTWFQQQGYAGVTKTMLARWACERRGPTFSKIGRHAYYEVADLERWLDGEKTRTRKVAA
jgi:hypothetical protein